MGFSKSSSKSTSYVTQITRDERMASEGGHVIRGSGNIIASGGDIVSQTATEEMGDTAREAVRAAEQLGASGLETAEELLRVVGEVIKTEEESQQRAKELDATFLETAMTAQRNLAESAVERATRLAETKMAGGVNPQVILQQIITGILVALTVNLLLGKK